MTQRLILISLSLLIIAIAVTAPITSHAGNWWQKLTGQKQILTTETIFIETQDDRRFQFEVEIAATEKEKSRGLMNRESLGINNGMLFLFGEEQNLAFWMKNTLIPLDMLFVTKDGTIHHIHSNARPLDETLITSPKPAAAVLEINGGQADKWDIKAGDKILSPHFRNVLAQ